MSANLNDAAMAGNMEEVLMRLNMGEDVNQKCYPRYSTPLHDATCCGRTEVVRLLLSRGANVNELDYKNSTPLKLATRYGQDDIIALLQAAGALDNVEPPKKISVAGVDPPWVRKSSRVSRREEIAGCDGNLKEVSKSENERSKVSKKKVKLKKSIENKVTDVEMDKKTKEAIEIEETKIKEIQLIENILEVEPIKSESPKITVELYDTVNDINDDGVGILEAQVVKHVFEDANLKKSWSGTELFLRNSPETTIGNLLENLPNVNKFPIQVTNIKKYLRPEDITLNKIKKEMPSYVTNTKLVEQQNVAIIPDKKEMLPSTLILEISPEASEETEETSINKNTQAEIMIETKPLEKPKVKNKFSSYQMKLAEKAKAAEPVKEEVKSKEPEILKSKLKQTDKKKVITKTTKKEPVKSKPPVIIQKANETKPKEKTQIKSKPMSETKTSEKKAVTQKQTDTKKVTSKQPDKQAPISKQSENLAMATIHSDECLENTKQQIKVTKIQTYLRPKSAADEMLNKPEEKNIFENLTNIKKVEVTGQTKSSVEARYIKLSAEREAVETSILESLESRRLKEENMPLGLGVAARNAAEMAMHVEGKQLVEKEYKDVEEIIEEVMYENQNESYKSLEEEPVVTHPANKVESAKQALKQKCQIFGKLKGTEENKEEKEGKEGKQSDQGIEKTKQVFKESWQKVKSKKTKIEEGKQTVTKQLDDKLGLTQKWNKIYKQKTNKSSIEETNEDTLKINNLEDNIGDNEELTEDQIKAQQAIIRKILEECVLLDQKSQQNDTEEKLEDITIESEGVEELAIEREETEDDTIIKDKKLTIAGKLDNHLKLKQKWEHVCKLKDNIKGKVSKKGDEENQGSDGFHIKTENVIQQKIQKFRKPKASTEATHEVEETPVPESFHIKAQNVIKQKILKFRKPKETVEVTQEIEEPSLPIDDQPKVGWFNKEEIPEIRELVRENTELETKQPQLGWFDKVGSLETESSLSMVGSPDPKLFNEVNMEQKEALDEQTNETDTNSQQFGWFTSEMESEQVEQEQEKTKETQKGFMQKWNKCRSMASSVMRPMK